MIGDSQKRKYLERLERRADHLDKRVTGNRHLTYDITELNALRWAIRTLRDMYNL